jgi:hypothetical protein
MPHYLVAHSLIGFISGVFGGSFYYNLGNRDYIKTINFQILYSAAYILVCATNIQFITLNGYSMLLMKKNYISEVNKKLYKPYHAFITFFIV